MNHKILLIGLFTLLSLLSCKKERLDNDAELLVGSWEGDYYYDFYRNRGRERVQRNEFSEFPNKKRKWVDFKKRGVVTFYNENKKPVTQKILGIEQINGPFTFYLPVQKDTLELMNAYEFRLDVEYPNYESFALGVTRIMDEYYLVVNEDNLILFIDRYNVSSYAEIYNKL